MKRHVIAAGLGLSLALWGATALAQDGSTTTTLDQSRDWGETLRLDATAFHSKIMANHPGPVDPENPAFRPRLDAGLAVALQRAETASDAGGWWWAMRAFTASFDDGHVQIRLRDQTTFPTRWPGFLTVYRGSDQVVATRQEGEADLPALGARLIDCDGIPADRLAETRIGEFRGRWFLESQRATYGDWLFINASNPWIEDLARCRFDSDGTVQTHALHWRDISAPDLATQRTAVIRRASPAFGMKRLDDGGFWLTMPSFNGTPGSDPHTALTAMLAEAEVARSELRAAPRVVLDLRRNGGGSSHWSGRLSDILWGSDWQTAHRLPPVQGVDWRASDDNIAEMSGLLDQFRSSDAGPDLIRWAESAVNGMTAALAAGQPYWFSGSDPDLVVAAPAPAANPMVGRVYVLTDSACASACLDAVDAWKAFGAVQIGRETSADTVYMEVGDGVLPSGLIATGIPMKVYRGWTRGNNEPQRPRHLFDGDMSDEAALADWVRTLD